MRTFCILIFLSIGNFLQNNNVYGIHITTIDEEDKMTDQFSGKKILVVVLPVIQTGDDSNFVASLNSINANYGDKISIIAVPSFEDGYTQDNLSALRFYYRSLFDSSITITSGMYTRKISGGDQHQLFHWLTYADANDHYDSEVTGPREMFFLNERGELYGTISPDSTISNKLLDLLINN